MNEIDHIFEAHRKLAASFKERREGLGLSVEDLAAKVNIPRSVLLRIEDFSFMPNIELLYRMAYFLGLELSVSPSPKDH